VIGRGAAALAALWALSCADDPVPVSQAPATLAASPAAVFAEMGTIAVATPTDDGAAREVALSSEAQVSLRAYAATASRAAQPAGARPLAAGAAVTLDLHTAITQLDASGRAVGRIENPFAGAPGRARLAAGRPVLAVLGDDALDATAWRVREAYALDAAGAALAEPALGFAAGTTLDALFAALPSP
jgi:hypothetical protein